MHRSITGAVLVQHLDQAARTIDATLLAQHGRSARTLVKEGPLRLTLMALGPGGSLSPHSTQDPISIHVVEGDVTFVALGCEYVLACGDVLVLAPGVEHTAASRHGAVFLLTVVHGDRPAATEPATPEPWHMDDDSSTRLRADSGERLPGIAKPFDDHMP